ncbi:hypothetical protein M3Y95_00835900 [Aphelenchoides besseyi]|nr:hypothetical protein M3Y95_00835900 [Aphelenchoides besseyi]
MQQTGTMKLNPQLTRHINQTPRKSRLSSFVRLSVENKNGNLCRSKAQSLDCQRDAPPTPRPLPPRRSYAKQKSIRDPACTTSLIEMIGPHKRRPTRQFSAVNQHTRSGSKWTKSQRDIRSQLNLAAASPVIQSPIYLDTGNSTSSTTSSANSPNQSEKMVNSVARKLNLVLDVNGRELPLKLDLKFDSADASNLRVKRILLDNHSILPFDQYGHFIVDQSS